MGLKEGRENCLREIEENTKKIKEIEENAEEYRVLSIVRELNEEERTAYIEQRKQIVRLRGNIACDLQVLLSCQAVGGLEEGATLSFIIEAMKREVHDYEEKLEVVEDNLNETYEYINLVKNSNQVGYNYLNDKFNYLYDQNSTIWAEMVSVCKSVLEVDAEISAIKAKKAKTETEEEPNA